MGRTEDLFFQGHDLAEVGDGFVILALAISRVGEPVPAPKCISMLGARALGAAFDNGAQDVLGFAVAELAFAKNKTPNRNAHYDTGAAMSQLTTEATSRGIFVHQMAGFDPDTAREVFEIPSGWDAIAAFAMGYPGDPASLPQPYRDRETAPRVRKPIGEFVMNGKWGHTADFILK